MDLGLKGKVAIVTGGSDGIGRAAATRFSQEGASVAIVSRTESDLQAVAAEISAETGNEVMPAPADVSDEGAVKSAVGAIAQRFGRVDILVNNAGTSSASKFEDMTNEQLDIDFTLKVKGAIFMTRYALPHLKQSPAHSSTDTGGYTWHTDHHWLQGGSSREVHSRDGAAAHSSTAEALLDNSSSPPHSAAAYLLPLGRKVTVTCTPSLCLLVIREYLRSRDYNLTHWWTRASAIWCVNILSK